MTLPAVIATWFGSGRLPGAPGTWGSLAALPCGALLVWLGGWPLLLIASIAVFIIGTWASERYARQLRKKDPSEIVVDEVVGQWLVLLPWALDPFAYLLAFAAFRIFDIAKPWPVSWADRQVKGGLGIMLDDVVAGAYALAVCILIHFATGWPHVL